MAVSLLHLVDERNVPVTPEIRIAVEAAYRWSVREYRQIDESELAPMAESVASAMAKRTDEIVSPRRYAFAALTGKIQEWFRGHRAKLVSYETEDELDRELGANEQFTLEVERRILFSQIRSRLNERDRQICVLMEQDLDSPRDVAKALHITYSAAAKALQRVRERMANMVEVERHGAEKSSSEPKILDFESR